MGCVKMKLRNDLCVLFLILIVINLSALYSVYVHDEDNNFEQVAFLPLVTVQAELVTDEPVTESAQEEANKETKVLVDKIKSKNEVELKDILTGNFDFSRSTLNLDAKYAILYDQTNKRILYAKNTNEKCYPASTTKLLTALVLIEYCDLDYVVTVGDEIGLIASDSSVSNIKRGMQISFYDLLQALLLVSGNDAAYTIAVNVSRLTLNNADLPYTDAVSHFTGLMNEKAKELGASNSFFETPDGYHSEGHYTTAADMLVIADAAISNKTIQTIVLKVNETVTVKSGETFEWKNSNSLLKSDSTYYYEYAVGLKTGYTTEAGYCLVSVAEKEGTREIAVLLGATDNAHRWTDAIKLLDFGFENAYNESYILH